MAAPTRSVAIELAENAEAITAWRNSLPEKRRRRLVNPQSVVKRWRASTGLNGKSGNGTPGEINSGPSHQAMAAWARFVKCVEALAPDQQRQLWHEAQARAAERLSRDAPLVCDATAGGLDLSVTIPSPGP